jgi:hypothetical protein
MIAPPAIANGPGTSPRRRKTQSGLKRGSMIEVRRD